ncbi:LuxR family transcriptional regulator [Litorimonas cladophorae]|uniref:LuxR family transcriptional regulator n=1 Tax=Litorimonas cladophorae TaxID=1220491 RepID=A0A918KFB2_9PROT|nr:TatD family hydrolase [Litorimonas cladophorae]GGX59013.1 LuxR family transcriptional regulator [Litorimonas cladophorae]
MIVDSHVNLHDEKFADDLAETILRARAAGVGPMLNICCHLKDAKAVLDVAQMDADIWATVGTHPHDAKDNPDVTAEEISALTRHPKVVAIGETGLDYHYDWSPRDVQKANFQAHIEAVQETGLPLVVHTREADDDMLEMLQTAYAKKPFSAIMHCYTSGQRLADAATEMGFYFSVSGIMTFKSAHEVRERILTMPKDRIMLETDCPYLAPVPYRGRRNEPAYVVEVCKSLAALFDWTIEETAQKTTDAFFNLFNKAQRPNEMTSE